MTSQMLETHSMNPVREVEHYSGLENVSVNREAIDALAEELASEDQLEIPSWTAPVFPEEDAPPETVVDFLMVGNTLNFAFNDPETGEKFGTEYIGDEWNGAFGMWAMLKRELDRGTPILEPEWLSSVTVDELVEISEPFEGKSLPHPEMRVKNLNSLGEFMSENGLDTFKTLFEETSVLHGQNGLINTLTECEAYQDERTYRGDTIVFNKRAQLAVTMVYDRLFDHSGYEWAKFTDVDSLTIFADYGIPAYLNTVGAIEYSQDLEEKIQSNTEISENSPEEVEIRIATVQVGSLLRDILEEEHNRYVGVPELDYALWERRQEADTNAHQTVTDSY